MKKILEFGGWCEDFFLTQLRCNRVKRNQSQTCFGGNKAVRNFGRYFADLLYFTKLWWHYFFNGFS